MNELNNSLAGLKEKKGVMIALIAVLLVPLIYAAIILTASWGPIRQSFKLASSSSQ